MPYLREQAGREAERPMTVTCRGFTATPIAGGEIRLEITNPSNDALTDQLYMDEIATRMSKTVKQIDQLSRRKKNPLPLIRGNGRPYALRTALNRWLIGVDRFPIGMGSATQTLYGN